MISPTVKAIKQAFGDNGPMYFSVSFFKHGTEGCRLWDVVPAIKAIGSYNSFSPAKLSKAFATIIQHVYSVKLGREYSPVIYIRATEAQDVLYIRDVLKRVTRPSELSISADGMEVRAWWD